MIPLIAAFLALSPLTEFKRRWDACEADKSLIGSSYAGCVVDAATLEQKEFHIRIDVAVRRKLISRRRLNRWEDARDKRCKRASQTTPYPYTEVVEADCRSRADDRFLKSIGGKSD